MALLYQCNFMREDLPGQTRHLTRGPIHPPLSTRAVATLKDNTTWSGYRNDNTFSYQKSIGVTFSKLPNLSLDQNYDVDAAPSVNHRQKSK